jgi:predicted nucleotidyltransferase
MTPPEATNLSEPIAAKLRAFFADRAEVEKLAAAWLFGSRARGTERAESDADVGVLFVEDPPPGLDGLAFHLEADLERLLHLPVQLVVLNRAPVDLAQRVLRDGVLLLDRDHARRIGFEVRTRQEFWDFEPFLRRYRASAGDGQR